MVYGSKIDDFSVVDPLQIDYDSIRCFAAAYGWVLSSRMGYFCFFFSGRGPFRAFRIELVVADKDGSGCQEAPSTTAEARPLKRFLASFPLGGQSMPTFEQFACLQ
eukprot:TRINITY_DN37898_c0_g1_i2.p2 TRINITY_DN37898_c0_g1~~TRINITY_DN37898_c0_g1_i2.p2  ORF type:complete len:106 (+),score=5.58 TRINITY_DN37898_c0_g1_i2:154-471(+)